MDDFSKNSAREIAFAIAAAARGAGAETGMRFAMRLVYLRWKWLSSDDPGRRAVWHQILDDPQRFSTVLADEPSPADEPWHRISPRLVSEIVRILEQGLPSDAESFQRGHAMVFDALLDSQVS